MATNYIPEALSLLPSTILRATNLEEERLNKEERYIRVPRLSDTRYSA